MLPSPDINQLTTEIAGLYSQLVKNMINYGKALIGDNASLKQIANVVGPQFGLTPDECLSLMIHMKGE